jgi:hypothetical protein
LREPFAYRCLDLIEEYAPGFRDLIIDKQVLTPLDLERRFGLTGGNIFHGEMSLDQMFVMRPVAGSARYRTPIRGLYLCGSGTHPGGGRDGGAGEDRLRGHWPPAHGDQTPQNHRRYPAAELLVDNRSDESFKARFAMLDPVGAHALDDRAHARDRLS